MASHAAKANDFVHSQTSEYAIYIYHLPENQLEGQNDWEMRSSTLDLQAALAEARALHDSKGYRKIEVKERVLNSKTRTSQDKTLKIFGGRQRQRKIRALCSSAAIIAMASIIVFTLFSIS